MIIVSIEYKSNESEIFNEKSMISNISAVRTVSQRLSAPVYSSVESDKSQDRKRKMLDHSDEEQELPLYKKLNIGDIIYAKFKCDGKFYKASVVRTIHKNYMSAMFDVKFDGYGNVETVSWRDIRESLEEVVFGTSDGVSASNRKGTDEGPDEKVD